MATSASAHIGRDHYRVDIKAGKNSLIADEPETSGGGGLGFDPYELLVASLGACTCATVRMYADRKQWKLEEIKVNLSLERDNEKNVTGIIREIEFIGDLSVEEKQRLQDIANRCPIHNILTHTINIATNTL